MKKIFFFIFLLFSLNLFSQEKNKPKYELGVNLITFNYTEHDFYNTEQIPVFQTFNEIYLKIKKENYTLRMRAYFNENKTIYLRGWNQSAEIHNDYQVLIGLQKNIFNEWMYGFADAGLRFLKTKGHYDGEFTSEDYSSISQGIIANIGIGFKINLNKTLCFSSEFSMNSCFQKTDTYIEKGWYMDIGKTYQRRNWINTPQARLMLGFRF